MHHVEVVQVAASLAIVPSSVHAILRWDEKAPHPEELDRAWPPSPRFSAVLGSFLAWGPFCLPIHFWRTRRGDRGIAFGILTPLRHHGKRHCPGRARALAGRLTSSRRLDDFPSGLGSRCCPVLETLPAIRSYQSTTPANLA